MDGTAQFTATITGPPPALSAHRRPIGPVRFLWTALMVLGFVAALAYAPSLLLRCLSGTLWFGFLGVITFKITACLLRPTHVAERPNRPRRLPHYTIVVALKDEAAIVPQLVRRLARIDYPRARLSGYLVVEPDDKPTLDAIQEASCPAWLRPLVAPPGEPTTKPRALNIALNLAPPGLLTIFDAEDEPHPEQLREAADRFRSAGPRLACLQAPLHIRTLGRKSTWLERQFALEYAALFGVILPALARLSLPLPLGGTSNHFRVEALKAVGGWDPWNVTEDADLGFRLARLGYETGVLTCPTRESPPPDLKAWIPQRTRWLKGFMQTIGVHLRRPAELGWRGLTSRALTLGAAVISASLQGLVLAWLVANGLIHGLNGTFPALSISGLVLLLAGWGVAGWTAALGASRSRLAYQWTDFVSAPLYWSLATIAQIHAAWRLAFQPYHWDKTPHAPDIVAIRPARRTLRNRASLPTLPASPNRLPGPWKFSISKTTPTSAPE